MRIYLVKVSRSHAPRFACEGNVVGIMDLASIKGTVKQRNEWLYIMKQPVQMLRCKCSYNSKQADRDVAREVKKRLKAIVRATSFSKAVDKNRKYRRANRSPCSSGRMS